MYIIVNVYIYIHWILAHTHTHAHTASWSRLRLVMFHDADGDSWCQGFREQCYPSKVLLMFRILSIYQNGVPNNIDPPCPKFIFQGSTTEWMRHDETSWISWVCGYRKRPERRSPRSEWRPCPAVWRDTRRWATKMPRLHGLNDIFVL